MGRRQHATRAGRLWGLGRLPDLVSTEWSRQNSSAIYELISPTLPNVAYFKPFACDVSVVLPLLVACLR
jgi:hypothetical protein